MKKKDTDTLILAAVLLWLLWPKKPAAETSVNMTSGGDEVFQICYDPAGKPYNLPVSSGPCPNL
jgi:hypothetical protein